MRAPVSAGSPARTEARRSRAALPVLLVDLQGLRPQRTKRQRHDFLPLERHLVGPMPAAPRRGIPLSAGDEPSCLDCAEVRSSGAVTWRPEGSGGCSGEVDPRTRRAPSGVHRHEATGLVRVTSQGSMRTRELASRGRAMSAATEAPSPSLLSCAGRGVAVERSQESSCEGGNACGAPAVTRGLDTVDHT